MSGHNKWSSIKHKKAATDAKRGKVFSKLAKEMMVAARQSGGDPATNISLRTLIQKARAANMPADNIERAIKKGTGELEGAQMEEVMYEGYAQGGVAVIVEALTDNRNRSAAEVRHVFSKHNCSMAVQGRVSRSFNRKGFIQINADTVTEEALFEKALEAGAEDISLEGDVFEVITAPADYPVVLEALQSADIAVEDSMLTLLPETYMPVTDRDAVSSLLGFIEALEALDDVQNVFSNFDIPDELLEELNEQ